MKRKFDEWATMEANKYFIASNTQKTSVKTLDNNCLTMTDNNGCANNGNKNENNKNESQSVWRKYRKSIKIKMLSISVRNQRQIYLPRTISEEE